MSRLELLDRETLEPFFASDLAVLMLAKTGCSACQAWTEQLEAELQDPSRWEGVRFGKLLLDTRGLGSFKKENPWLAQVDVLPYNLIYLGGERRKSFAGGGLERLEGRLRRLQGQAK